MLNRFWFGGELLDDDDDDDESEVDAMGSSGPAPA